MSEHKTLQIGAYTIDKKLGKGQFASVYRARRTDNPNGDLFALKRISIAELSDEKARMDCLKEIDLLKSLDHPNVTRYLDSFIEGDELYIILELAEAGDLLRMIQHFKKQQRLIPEKTIWKYFVQICSALAHMHERRIMHRDIKPANVLINGQGVVKLCDLGLGRSFSSNTVAAHSLVGTPYYMSPERIKERGYTFASDIWSIGCLLYELAALHSPFWGEKMTLIILCQKIDACDYPTKPLERYSTELRELVAACIVTNPEDRPSIHDILKIAKSKYLQLKAESEKQKAAEMAKSDQVTTTAPVHPAHMSSGRSSGPAM